MVSKNKEKWMKENAIQSHVDELKLSCAGNDPNETKIADIKENQSELTLNKNN